MKKLNWIAAILLLALALSACTPTGQPQSTDGSTGPSTESTTPVETTPDTQPDTQSVIQPVTQPPFGHSLSNAELDQIRAQLFPRGNTSWYQRALNSTYAFPQEMDVSLLIYGGAIRYERAPWGVDELSQAEWDYLLNHGWTENAFHFSSFRMPKAAIERVLQLYFHISLDEANTAAMEERYPYWAETDCYYQNCSDSAVPRFFLVDGLRLDDGTLFLSYVTQTDIASPVYVLQLCPTEPGDPVPYYVYSNLPDTSGRTAMVPEPEWNPPDPATPKAGDPVEEAELEELQRMLQKEVPPGEYGEWYRIACQDFDRPEEVNIATLLQGGLVYYGLGGMEACFSPAELDYVREAGLEGAVSRYPKEVVEKMLEEFLGVELEDTQQLGLRDMLYWDRTECYYAPSVADDFPEAHLCSGTFLDEETMELYFNTDPTSSEPTRMMTVKFDGDPYRQYHVVSCGPYIAN